MESQSQYPELKNNPEYVHPRIYNENEIPVGRSNPFIGEFFLSLTLKAPITTAVDDKFCHIFPNLRKKNKV